MSHYSESLEFPFLSLLNKTDRIPFGHPSRLLLASFFFIRVAEYSGSLSRSSHTTDFSMCLSFRSLTKVSGPSLSPDDTLFLPFAQHDLVLFIE